MANLPKPVEKKKGTPDNRKHKGRKRNPRDEHGLTANQRAFLSGFIKTGTNYGASKESGFTVSAHVNWLQETAYREHYANAKEMHIQMIESEMIRRGAHGVTEPILDKNGNIVGEKKKYSDSLLLKALSSKRPEVYGDRLSVDNRNVNVNVNMQITSEMSTKDAMARLEMLKNRIAAQECVPISLPESIIDTEKVEVEKNERYGRKFTEKQFFVSPHTKKH